MTVKYWLLKQLQNPRIQMKLKSNWVIAPKIKEEVTTH
jgi:hypothetical protein